MDELVETLKRAQCAVLHAQRDLIVLRRAQEEPDGGVGPSRQLQWSAQERQEEAVRHLETSVRLLHAFLRDCGETYAAQRSMDSAKRAMHRYLSTRLAAEAQREADRADRLSVAMETAAVFAQRGAERRLMARAWRLWCRRWQRRASRRVRVEVGRQLNRTRGAVAVGLAASKARAALRLRCFYRWRVRQLGRWAVRAASRAQSAECVLSRAQSEVRRAEDALCAHLSAAAQREGTAWREATAEAERLRRAMEEMAHEFSERTSAYVRQQEELAQHFAAREERLLADGATAQHRAAQHAAALPSFALRWAERAVGAAQQCVADKALALADAAACVVAAQEQRVDGFAARVHLLAPTLERATRLEGECRAWMEKRSDAVQQLERTRGELRGALADWGEERHEWEAEALFAAERAARLGMHSEAFSARLTLERQLHHRVAQEQSHVADYTSHQLASVGGLVVEYCARDAFGRWRAFAERRAQRHAVARLNATSRCTMDWFRAAAQLLATSQNEKLRVFTAAVHAQRALEMRGVYHRHNQTLQRFVHRGGLAFREFVDVATRWVGEREGLFAETCSLVSVTASPPPGASGEKIIDVQPSAKVTDRPRQEDTMQEGVGDIVASLREPLWTHDYSGLPHGMNDNDVLDEAMCILSAERAELASRVQQAVDVMRFTAAEALEVQRRQHEDQLEELLAYQHFLEEKIMGRNQVNSGTQTCMSDAENICLSKQLDDLHLQLDEARRTKVARDAFTSPCFSVVEAAVQTASTDSASVENAMADTLRQYGGVLRVFERDVEERRAAFFTATNMLAEVDRFSEALLSRCASDLDAIAAMRRSADGGRVAALESQLRAARRALLEARAHVGPPPATVMPPFGANATSPTTVSPSADHESEMAALMTTLRATREKSEAEVRALRAQLERVEHETRAACESRSLRAQAALKERVESLLSTIDRNNADFESERGQLDDAARALRAELHKREEHAQQLAAQVRERCAKEMDALRVKHEEQRTRSDTLAAAVRDKQTELDAAETEVRALQEHLGQVRAAAASECITAVTAAMKWMTLAGDLVEAKLLLFLEALSALVWRPTVGCARLTTPPSLPLPAQSWEVTPISVVTSSTARAEEGVGRDSQRRRSGSNRPIASQEPQAGFFTPLRSSVSASDVAQSMVRYTRMVNDQCRRNDSCVQKLDSLVTQFDDLIERGRVVSQLERSLSRETSSIRQE